MSGRRKPARRARRSSGRSRPDNPASDARSARPAVQGIRLPGRIFFGGDRGPLGRADCGPRTRLRRVFVRRLCRLLPCGELVPRPRLHLPGKRAHPHDAVASPRARRNAACSRTGQLGRGRVPRRLLWVVRLRHDDHFVQVGGRVARPGRGAIVDSAGRHGARTCDSFCRNDRRSRRRATRPQHLLRHRPGTQDRGHARFRALMELWIISAVVIAALAALLVAGVWIALTLLGVGWVAMVLFTHSPAGGLMATTVWGSSTSWALTALPLFIWMGEILFRTRISEDMFRGLAPWMAPLPGRLMHCNVAGCGIFAAISGSSAATAATIGGITIPELLKRGYDETMTIGSLAGAGTLGLLIPPSIIMIVYGVAADVSIARLFVAGVLPGIMLMLMFSGYIVAWALFNPGKTPPRDQFTTLGEKLRAARHLIPAVLLIGAVIGSIYAGVATPTEAAGSLSWRTFEASVMGATKTSCMIAFILAGAAFLTTAMAFTGVPRIMAQWIGEQGFAAWQLIAVLTVLYIILGCFIDGISMVVLTSSVILPSVKATGIDLLWFGIFVVLVVEMAQITPPVGFNLFVLQGLTGKDMFYVARASLPFFILMVLAVAIIWNYPEIVTYLPGKMFNLS